jgi:HAD superfamily phosphatase (TIGR01668 family)
MFQNMKADIYLNSVFDIDSDSLKQKGIRGILFDIDNTLEPYHTAVPGRAVIELFHKLSCEGFKIGVISNAKMERALEFCENATPFWIAKAGKPLARGYRQLAAMMELEPEELAAVGDQLYTDILGGNRFGCYTIYVKPLEGREPPFVALKRLLEKPFLKGIV